MVSDEIISRTLDLGYEYQLGPDFPDGELFNFRELIMFRVKELIMFRAREY